MHINVYMHINIYIYICSCWMCWPWRLVQGPIAYGNDSSLLFTPHSVIQYITMEHYAMLHAKHNATWLWRDVRELDARLYKPAKFCQVPYCVLKYSQTRGSLYISAWILWCYHTETAHHQSTTGSSINERDRGRKQKTTFTTYESWIMDRVIQLWRRKVVSEGDR